MFELPLQTRLLALLLVLPLFAFASTLMIACNAAIDDSSTVRDRLYGYGYAP